MSSPIARWHALVASKDFAALEALFTDDAVFVSPALHTPQRGKVLVCGYLRAALKVLDTNSFRYTGEWQTEGSAVLEFEVQLDEIFVNGVDIIRWNEAGLITEFKVMIRPLKALNQVMAHMAQQLMSNPPA